MQTVIQLTTNGFGIKMKLKFFIETGHLPAQ